MGIDSRIITLFGRLTVYKIKQIVPVPVYLFSTQSIGTCGGFGEMEF